MQNRVSLLVLTAILSCFEIGFTKELPYYASDVFLAPTRKDLIIVDFYLSEAGQTPRKAMLYSLPLKLGAGKPLDVSALYEWAFDGQKFATIQISTGEDFPIMKSTISLYDRNGAKSKLPGFGSSPKFVTSDQILYCREYSDDGALIAPQLTSFDIKTGERSKFYEFDDEFTCWTPDPADTTESVTGPISKWGGYVGTVYKKKSRNENFTYFIPWKGVYEKGVSKGAKLVIWQGNQTNSDNWPLQKPYLEKR